MDWIMILTAHVLICSWSKILAGGEYIKNHVLLMESTTCHWECLVWAMCSYEVSNIIIYSYELLFFWIYIPNRCGEHIFYELRMFLLSNKNNNYISIHGEIYK
jgi:hypothetical protein